MTTDTQQRNPDAVDAGFDDQLVVHQRFCCDPSTRGAEGP